MPSLDDLALETERKLGVLHTFFPLLPTLGNRWAARRPFAGAVIGLHVHVTPVTAAFARELQLGGARVVVCAVDPETTDTGATQLLRRGGIDVLTVGPPRDRYRQVLRHAPDLLVDATADLLREAANHPRERLRGAVLTTRTAVEGVQELLPVPIPVVNAHDTRLRDAINGRLGVARVALEAVGERTGLHLAGRQITVVGYGPMGRGLAEQARSLGLAVDVVEIDPVRRLTAHYDGFRTPSYEVALRRADLVVTATGKRRVLQGKHLGWLRHGAVLFTVGAAPDEIDASAIQAAADEVDHLREGVVAYRLGDGRTILLLGAGRPLHLQRTSGSHQHLMLHDALVGACLGWLIAGEAAPGLHAVPASVESEIAKLAEQILGLEGAGE
jgi:adenosylhomocysteinase